ncbi:MAG: hypothetical protein M1450_04425, partial [Patescibacteria group bacterium]|nr:hypothetical protein [Patescibacteria group bacterium]
SFPKKEMKNFNFLKIIIVSLLFISFLILIFRSFLYLERTSNEFIAYLRNPKIAKVDAFAPQIKPCSSKKGLKNELAQLWKYRNLGERCER